MWNKLSMKDRAEYIKLGVANGITSLDEIRKVYNQYAGGGELDVVLPELVVTPESSYINYTGEETVVPTMDEYIKAKIDETRHSAYLNMLHQETPLVPRVPDRTSRVKAAKASLLGYLGYNTEEIIDKVGLDKDALTCAWTSTGQYPESSRVSGNKTFADNHQKYGFVRSNEPKVGDLMVAHRDKTYIPYHMTMVTGFNDYGIPLLSYSMGGHSPEDMIHNSEDWQEDLPNIINYTYVGTQKERDKWKKEYKKLYNK